MSCTFTAGSALGVASWRNRGGCQWAAYSCPARLMAYRTWVAYCELQVPSTSRSISCSNPSNSRFPPPNTSGAVEIRARRPRPPRDPADQVGTTTEGDPAVAGELARLQQRGIEAVNEQEARTRIGLVLGAVCQHNQRAGERVVPPQAPAASYMFRPTTPQPNPSVMDS